MAEVTAAMRSFSTGKALDLSGVRAELLQASGRFCSRCSSFGHLLLLGGSLLAR